MEVRKEYGCFARESSANTADGSAERFIDRFLIGSADMPHFLGGANSIVLSYRLCCFSFLLYSNVSSLKVAVEIDESYPSTNVLVACMVTFE